MVEELESGIHRVTFDLPFGIDHVHCYFLRSTTGGWILVDTGLGSRDPEARWRSVLDELDAPVERIVVTHMHPDHVGGARDIAGLTGAPVLQGREDHAQCVRAWGERNPERFAAYWAEHGLPESHVQGLAQESDRLVAAVHWMPGPELLDAGDEVDGWRVEVLRGHADGHIVLLRDGVMIAGDVILDGITPAIGLYPNSRPDPLGDYFETLGRIEELAPRIAYAGHKTPLRTPLAGRVRSARTTSSGSTTPQRRSGASRALPTRSRCPSSERIFRRRCAALRRRRRWRTSSVSCRSVGRPAPAPAT